MNEIKEKKVEEIKKEAQGKGCPVQQAYYYIDEFISGPMCGKCFPCSFGVYEARIRLKRLIDGQGTEADVKSLARIASEMSFASFCKKGKDTAKFITEWIGNGVYNEHAKGRCPEKLCRNLLEYKINSEKCTNCGACLDACKYNAILGEKRVSYMSGYLPFEIRQARCVKCGDCVPACPENAIEITDKTADLVKA